MSLLYRLCHGCIKHCRSGNNVLFLWFSVLFSTMPFPLFSHCLARSNTGTLSSHGRESNLQLNQVILQKWKIIVNINNCIPSCDLDPLQNFMGLSLACATSFTKIGPTVFFCNPTERQTNKPTNRTVNMTSLAEASERDLKPQKPGRYNLKIWSSHQGLAWGHYTQVHGEVRTSVM